MIADSLSHIKSCQFAALNIDYLVLPSLAVDSQYKRASGNRRFYLPKPWDPFMANHTLRLCSFLTSCQVSVKLFRFCTCHAKLRLEFVREPYL